MIGSTSARPRIAVLLDENTSGGGDRYEAGKGYFGAVATAGGLPFGIPYLPAMVEAVPDSFDGLLCVGGRFAYPDEWYLAGERSAAPPSGRLPIERALAEAFLARDKPLLGLCAGMQLLACLHGCRLTADLRAAWPDALGHDGPGVAHPVDLAPGSRLAGIVGEPTLMVNSFHREAIAAGADGVRMSAHAPDGVIEAVEIPSRRFAIGLQWHQERIADPAHGGYRLFAAFVAAARGD